MVFLLLYLDICFIVEIIGCLIMLPWLVIAYIMIHLSKICLYTTTCTRMLGWFMVIMWSLDKILIKLDLTMII